MTRLKKHLRLPPGKGRLTKVHKFIKAVDALSKKVKTFEKASERITSKKQYETTREELINLRSEIFEMAQEGNDLYAGFNPIKMDRSRAINSDPMEQREYILHKCLRAIEATVESLDRWETENMYE